MYMYMQQLQKQAVHIHIIPANIRKSENWVQSIARSRSDQARGREATEGGGGGGGCGRGVSPLPR